MDVDPQSRLFRRTFLALLLASLSGSVLQTFTASTPQSFAAYGMAKAVSAPLILILLLGILAIAKPVHSRRPPIALHWIMVALATLVVLSAIRALGMTWSPRALIEDATLFVIALLAYWAGNRCAVMLGTNPAPLLHAALRIGAIVLIVAQAFGARPNSATTAIGTGFGLLMLRRYGHRTDLVLAVLVAGQPVLVSVQRGELSSALAAQLAVGCALSLTFQTRSISQFHNVLTVAAAIATLVMAYRLSGVADLMTGGYQGKDVTLLHRQYEAAAVAERASSEGDFVMGLGMGSSVSLIGSPDARTLLSSGRVLTEVRAVHLLPAFLALKFGLLGLIWVSTFTVALLARYWRPMVDLAVNTPVRVGLLFGLLSLVNALPAATNLFSDPVPLFLLGVAAAMMRQAAFDTSKAADD